MAIAAALFATWRGQGGNTSASWENRSSWSCVYLASSSAEARWLISPPSRSRDDPATSSSPARRASSALIPHRPMPLSSLTCTGSGSRAAARSRASPSTDETATSTPVTSSSSPGASGLITSTGAPGRSARSARASSHVATHSLVAPAASAARPTSDAPWP